LLLSKDDLSYTNLSFANVFEADLSGVNLTKANLSGVMGYKKAPLRSFLEFQIYIIKKYQFL
jgi:hypothetical protein